MSDLETLIAIAVPEQDVIVKSQDLAAQELNEEEMKGYIKSATKLSPNHPSDVGTETTQGYTYTRTDGTMEHAANTEEAIKACPVLGKMSVEQANVILELAAIGKEKMAQEATKRPEEQEPKHTETVKPEKAVKRHEPVHQAAESLAKSAVVRFDKKSLALGLEHAIRQQELAAAEAGATIGARNASQEFSAPLAVKIKPNPILSGQSLPKVVDLIRQPVTFINDHITEVQSREHLLAKEILNNPGLGYMTNQARPEPALDSVLYRAPAAQISVANTEQPSTVFEPASSATGMLELGGLGEELVLPALDAVLDLDELAAPGGLIYMPEDGLEEFSNRMELQEVVAINREEALGKEPLELYDDFVEALQIFAEVPTAPLVSELDDNPEVVDAEDSLIVNEQEIQLATPVSMVVAEKLAEFELIDKEQFMQAVLQPEFQPPQPVDKEALDLEHTGTREVKYSLSSLASSLTYVEHKLDRVLGVFVLLCTLVTRQWV